MRVPIAREGHPFLVGTAVIAIALWAARVALASATIGVAAALITAVWLALLFFFRDPERHGPRGARLVIAPADGRVVEVAQVEGPGDPDYIGGPCLRISVFLSLLDVHVNRYPVSGKVEHRGHHPGRFQAAWRHAAATENARSSTGIRAGAQPLLVRQVAGLVARRIVTYPKIGDSVQQGDRMGIILFGSRLDLYLPPGARPDVEVGARTRGGVTVVAHLEGEDRGRE